MQSSPLATNPLVPFTDQFLIGVNRAKSTNNPPQYTTDFTAAATTQTYTLFSLAANDIVYIPTLLDVIAVLTGPSISAATLSVGVTGDVDRFLPAVSVLAAIGSFAGQPALTDSTGGSVSTPNTLALLTSGGTAGDLAPIANAIAKLALKYNDTRPYVAAAAIDVIATLTTTGANVSVATTGQFSIMMNVSRWQDRVTFRQP